MVRNTKRGVIIGVYLLVFIGFGLLAREALAPAPTCFDGKLNQNEAEVDCGGVCGACRKPVQAEGLQVREVALVYGGTKQYDVLARIHNPNDQYGASEFSYTFFVKDDQGRVVAERKGKSFVLPKETKYVIEMGLETDAKGDRVGIEIGEMKWESFSGYREPPALTVSSRQFSEITSGVGYYKAFGILANESDFDFQSLTVKVVLRDEEGKPVALNKTEMRTVASGERRDVGPLVWPTRFPGGVVKMEMETEADVYRSDNFIRQYVPGAKYPGL
jgi:hypothetical protein